MPSWLFDASAPYASYQRWWFAIVGEDRRCHGPFPSQQAASEAKHVLFRKWVARARHLGGEAVRLRDDQWVVTLPPGVPCEGRPFRGGAVAHHGSAPTDAEVPPSS